MQRGKFIVIEGIDGAGKSTVVEALCNFLTEKVLEGPEWLVRSFEPGGTDKGQEIRRILKTPGGTNIPPISELLLFYADRAITVEEVIKPALEQGKWVVSDRHNLSTVAYQGAGRGLAQEAEILSKLVLDDFTPDFTVVLDIPAEQGIERARQRDNKLDRIEQAGLPFFEKARARFLEEANRRPKKVVVVDATLPKDTVVTEVLRQVWEHCIVE
jgi:dTMP kinase